MQVRSPSLPFPAMWQLWVSGLAGLDLPKELATLTANGDDDSNSNGNLQKYECQPR